MSFAEKSKPVREKRWAKVSVWVGESESQTSNKIKCCCAVQCVCCFSFIAGEKMEKVRASNFKSQTV